MSKEVIKEIEKEVFDETNINQNELRDALQNLENEGLLVVYKRDAYGNIIDYALNEDKKDEIEKILSQKGGMK